MFGENRCGFCFDEGNSSTAGQCLPYRQHGGSQTALMGRCNRTLSDSDTLTWTKDWCPTGISWLIVVGLVLYLICFSAGMGPMPWTINAEIYPQWCRSFGNGLATSVNWTFNLAISVSFLSLMNLITREGAYYFYSGLAVSAVIFFWWVLPETRGRTLEDMEVLFSRPWCSTQRPSRDAKRARNQSHDDDAVQQRL